MKVTRPDSERYFEGIRPEWAGIQFSSLDPLFTRKHVSYLLKFVPSGILGIFSTKILTT